MSLLSICGQLFLLCPFGSSAPLHFEHLCSGHAKLLEFRWSELPHALHRGFGQCASSWPCSWQRSHTSSLGRSCCICASSVHELTIVLDGHSRAEMAGFTACIAYSVRTRTIFLAMPRLRAQRTVVLARWAVCMVRFRSAVNANHRVRVPIMIRFRFL